MLRTTFFRLHVGGYWASDGSYNGGDIRRCTVDFENPRSEDHNRKELCGDYDVAEMINNTYELESMNLYVVRVDDPYLDDVLVGEEEEEEEPENEDEPIDFYRDDYADSDSDDDGQNLDFFVDQAFLSKETCKKAIEKYAIKEKVNLRFKKSESVVKLYTAPKIAASFLSEFRTNRTLSADQIKQRLSIQGLRVPKTKCQSARQIMLHIISDEYAEQFTRMYDYVEELRESNPGSTVILGTKDKVFEKFYTCFEAQKTGRDPNNQMFIIAWAIVPVENKVNWEWFMTLLQEDLNLELGNGLGLSSDKQKGLIYAIKTVLPYAEHRMCARHIWANLKKRHGESGNLHGLFWKCAKAYDMQVFERRLEKMKSVRPEAYEEVKKSMGSNWSRAFFNNITKSAAVENNISESYNAALKDARYKPVVALLEDIRRHVMSSNLVKIKEMESATGTITPKAKAVIEKRKKNLKWCQPLRAGKGWYESI
ncbi:unnamed protein product [Arabidopsis thaliana]|uniref:(thale cress) hypothetical protein n=1 Tax=Arabidopsis thaliana TaxID=3702 RepID=A0A7G2DYX3_ARATH|nr:unnamed protein product [Arabidopsis thaliana]